MPGRLPCVCVSVCLCVCVCVCYLLRASPPRPLPSLTMVIQESNHHAPQEYQVGILVTLIAFMHLHTLDAHSDRVQV